MQQSFGGLTKTEYWASRVKMFFWKTWFGVVYEEEEEEEEQKEEEQQQQQQQEEWQKREGRNEMFAQSHAVHWTQEYDKEEGL